MAQANVALSRFDSLKSLLGVEAVNSVATPRHEMGNGWRTLELIDVTYTYNGNGNSRPFQLGPINLVLRPGEITFLVGGNGSGKTTLGKVIAGLYGPDAGDVRLDGEALSRVGQQESRSLFSAVFNDFCLFDDFPGIAPVRMSQARHYLRALKLDHTIKIESGCLSTTEVSQGQRKRLALLVALLEDRPIYLFDEWAAEQDPEFKESFYRRIIPDLSRNGKAVIVITHDDRYFDLADHLIKLEDGSASRLSPGFKTHGESTFLKAINLRERFDAKVL